MSRVYREANFCADGLANLEIEAEGNFTIFQDCHDQIRHFVPADIAGVATPHVVVL